ncbi:pre-mRNA-splicing factor 18 [Brachionus plicatilis]|uniref:Pre-mRNA-splicing factor 18 n=1 Tax=Brachionus plicatilis TaxID=10195 RepID=A0A3M7RHX0_BRAPC|nr:pre-mRNA-splicing factor 18 [Brachionus plicatilis]
MDLLKNEIAKKRKELEEANLLKNGQKKYFKRGDFDDILTKRFIEQNLKNATESDESSRDSHDLNSKADKNREKEDLEKKILPRHEVVRRLKERGEPIRLFGETDLECYKRLNLIETSEPKENGMRNDFRMAIEKSEQENLNELMKTVDTDELKNQMDVEVKDDGIDFNEIVELSKKAREKNIDSQLVLKFIKFLVKQWGKNLNSRTLDEKLTVRGKIETALHSQTSLYLKPLCRKLKARVLPDDILDSLVKICLQLIERNYIKANEYFLEMAIGNAPWPIGATMVGIHARPGRERIASKHVAHVLNDETQRKYIQAVKRLISKCQQYYPTDPSRCVEYGIKNENITIMPK